MKKLIKLSLVLLMSLMISCSNEDSLNELPVDSLDLSILSKDEIETASLTDKSNYKRYHLKVLATFITKEKKLVNEIIKSKNIPISDEHQEFFIENLVNEMLSFEHIKITDEKLKVIEKSLNAFKDLDGENWYPKIFFRNEFSSESKTNSMVDRTFVAIEDLNENGEYFSPYELLDNDSGEEELFLLNDRLTPEYVGSNSLMVVELGLPCGDGGADQIQRCSSGGGGSGGVTGQQNLVINKMTIKDLKEDWPGRSEVSFKGYKVTDINQIAYDCNLAIYASVNCWTWNGNRIARVKRKNKNKEKTYNWKIKTTNNLSNDIIYYVIFEQDSWPATEKFAYFDFPSGLTSRIPYRSWQSIYDLRILSQNPNNQYNFPNANNFDSENNDIKYNLKLN
jgi:hypothetical protein